MAIVTVRSKGQLKSIESSLSFAQALELIKHSRSTFAQDLLRQYHRDGRLSQVQQAWVVFMAQEDLNRAQARQDRPRVQVGDFQKLVALFARAQENGLQKPRIRLSLADGSPLVLSIVGSGFNAGKLRVTNGLPRDDDRSRFYGFVDQSGSFGGSNPEVIALLQQFAQDPAGVSARYGKSSGECCFCGIALSNGESGSVSVGYGPICARRYDLPWEPNGKGYELLEGAPVVASEPVSAPWQAPEPAPFTLQQLLAGAAARTSSYDQLPAVLV